MNTRVEWVRDNCRLLKGIAEEFSASRPFEGLTIGTGIHLEPKTVALLLTLKEGGARVVSTGNLNSTQQTAVDHLRTHGVEVIGGPTRDPEEHRANLVQVLEARPQLILDNGGDLFTLYLERPYDGLLGGTEETTSGRMRLEPLRAQLRVPILVINDSPIKQFAENEHAVGQSVLESYMRVTNRVTNGQRVTVFGYGSCGRGVAENFKGAHAQVSVAEVDPVKRLNAHLDGYATPHRDEAIAGADLIVTVTGGERILRGSDLALLKDGVILANAGHFPVEIDVPDLRAHASVTATTQYEDGVESLHLDDGRTVHLVTEGHMFNLAGPRPLGNSIESMDLGFALQARCLQAVAADPTMADACVVPVPVDIDNRVANAYLDLHYSAPLPAGSR
ncbi:MAG: S-adenosyl-L-homocysteine hydrolase [Frankiales bacterium]|nr:S-adenosyl-L-homocysteine hydrolase [Frankiales bacterium]